MGYVEWMTHGNVVVLYPFYIHIFVSIILARHKWHLDHGLTPIMDSPLYIHIIITNMAVLLLRMMHLNNIWVSGNQIVVINGVQEAIRNDRF